MISSRIRSAPTERTFQKFRAVSVDSSLSLKISTVKVKRFYESISGLRNEPPWHFAEPVLRS